MSKKLVLWSLFPILSTLYQFFIKMVAVNMDGVGFSSQWLLEAMASPWIWAALVSEAIAFAIWIQILSENDLSKAFPLSAIGYVLVLAMGWIIFKEEILPTQLIGTSLILAGVWLIASPIKITQN